MCACLHMSVCVYMHVCVTAYTHDKRIDEHRDRSELHSAPDQQSSKDGSSVARKGELCAGKVSKRA